MSQRVRFGMLGTGNFSPFLAQYINEVAEVVAICDPSPEARARFMEMTGRDVLQFEDYRRLLEEAEIDAVALTGPNHTHKPMAVAAAGFGRHVFCEKAMAPTVPDCWEMVRACESAGGSPDGRAQAPASTSLGPDDPASGTVGTGPRHVHHRLLRRASRWLSGMVDPAGRERRRAGLLGGPRARLDARHVRRRGGGERRLRTWDRLSL